MCSKCLHAFTYKNSQTQTPHINIRKIHMQDKNELLVENSWNTGHPFYGTEPFKVRVKYPKFCDSQKRTSSKEKAMQHFIVCLYTCEKEFYFGLFITFRS